MMLRVVLAGAGLIAVASAAGCGQSPEGSPTGVAIIDLDRVASQLGSDKQIAAELNRQREAFNKQLVGLANARAEQLGQQRKQAAGENGGVRLASYEAAANQELSRAKQQAQAELQKRRGLLLQQFRDRVRPVAREVARERGLAVIVTQQPGLILDYARDADITEEVVERLKQPATNPAE